MFAISTAEIALHALLLEQDYLHAIIFLDIANPAKQGLRGSVEGAVSDVDVGQNPEGSFDDLDTEIFLRDCQHVVYPQELAETRGTFVAEIPTQHCYPEVTNEGVFSNRFDQSTPTHPGHVVVRENDVVELRSKQPDGVKAVRDDSKVDHADALEI